ncbi:MAG: acetate--CoA ligase family protein, partial [Candidatus Binataceae bacterium]
MSYDRSAVRAVIAAAKADRRNTLSPAECRALCEACAIPLPKAATASSAAEAGRAASALGFPVVMKIVSPDILHKTEAGGVVLNVRSAAEAERVYEKIVAGARAYKPDAKVAGVEIQQMLSGGQEVIVGATADPSFGKVVAFGLGGVLVEVLKDITFRLAPASRDDALSMINGIAAAEILGGVRGAAAVDKDALAAIIETVSTLAADFPEIAELDLNPVLARPDGAVALDVRVLLDFAPPAERYRPSREEILRAMNRIMRPGAIAVIGASAEDGKIGNSVMKNLINGGFEGEIYPIHPKLPEVMGRKAYRSVKEVPGEIDVAVFAIPAPLVAGALKECGEKKIPGAVLIPSGFAETGNVELQNEIVKIGRQYNVRLMGPNIYGFYYLPRKLCATFCTPYDVLGKAALSSQSGGVGMAIVGFSRSTRMGVSAIVGLGNKSDLDEDDLLTFFEQDDDTQVIAMHVEDLKDGRSFAEVAKRVSRKKPVIVLKAGRTALGARAARSHTAALAGNDRIYEDVLRQSGVVRARALNDMLEFARCLPIMAAPKGENVLIITGAGGSGVLLSDACVDNGLKLMEMPPDLDAAFRKFIPP